MTGPHTLPHTPTSRGLQPARPCERRRVGTARWCENPFSRPLCGGYFPTGCGKGFPRDSGRDGNLVPARDKAGSARPTRVEVHGFTLIELIVVVSIIAVILGVVTLAFRSATDSSILSLARNTLVNTAKLARSYAIANEIETMMVVNPYSGQIELWHANPPAQGGEWDPLSDTLGDGYAFAPVFDSGARLPVDGSGRPRVAVHPIDYDFRLGFSVDPLGNPSTNTAAERDMDNLTWTALCFDASGRLVTRTRRIATRSRSYLFRDGINQRSDPNRLPDGQPDLAILTDPDPSVSNVLVHGGNPGDTPITSAVGFVISDARRMRDRLGVNPTPQNLVDDWLRHTVPPEDDLFPDLNVAGFADTIILNRFSAQELAEAS
ncbi:MAG: Tfp pilus assembly protein FimT/FimU [Phycisphaerae bacterium]